MKRILAMAASAILASAIFAAVANLSVSAEPEGIAESSEQPGLVEDYIHPGADYILAEYGFIVTSGDGNILFTNCATEQGPGVGLLQVRTTEGIGIDGRGFLCFRISANTGYLNLKVPAVYEIRGDGSTQEEGHKVRADLVTEEGERSSVEVNPNGSTPVGIGAAPENSPTTLLRLQAHP
jgi:hypothetical protein